MTARHFVLCATSVPFLGGCFLLGDHDSGDGNAEEPPQIVAISRDQIRVGERLEFLGDRLEEDMQLRFEGEFRGDEGSIHRVDLTLRPQLVAPDRLVIPYFGPYQVPFGDGDEIGRFTGTVTVIGAGGESAPVDFELRVAPSIIVRKLASSGTSCSAPSRILLSGGRLHLTAEAIGFEASEIAVRLGGGAEVSSADGTVELDIPAVADGTLFAVVELVLTARGAGDDVIDSEYLIGIHRLLDYVHRGAADVAQIEAPIPVSGCHSGGDTQGRVLTYSEQESDERSRQVGYTWNGSWLEQNGEPTDVEIVEIGLRRAVDGPRLGPQTDTWTVGYDEFERTGPGIHAGRDGLWEISSADVLGDQQGIILPGEYGVWYRQATRLLLPGALVERNACGMSAIVAETAVSDYRWDVTLAPSHECPPLPKPDLPPAECFIQPCQ